MTLHRQIIMLCLLLVWGSSTAFSINYQKEFGDDWTQAEKFVKEHRTEWKQIFEEFEVDADIATAIVFPELIRYSRWQDAIETAAVNGLYISGGKEKANFSIGRFQMKPSFAEEIDEEWNKSKLAREFNFLFDTRDASDARRNRLKRLGTLEGQCRYLAIFIRLMFLRHPRLQTLPKEQQIRFLATAYNRSHTASWEQNLRMQKQCHFHTDMIKTRSTKTYRYSDIAVTFYHFH
jgi:hypothetical protein